mmetsp:Transcript_2928/g.4455  ORF Transcript_2928/g.4455 Transcript_2928/m.4455 type:complete len:220 (-) Transcript_2928:647-1306(-)
MCRISFPTGIPIALCSSYESYTTSQENLLSIYAIFLSMLQSVIFFLRASLTKKSDDFGTRGTTFPSASSFLLSFNFMFTGNFSRIAFRSKCSQVCGSWDLKNRIRASSKGCLSSDSVTTLKTSGLSVCSLTSSGNRSSMISSTQNRWLPIPMRCACRSTRDFCLHLSSKMAYSFSMVALSRCPRMWDVSSTASLYMSLSESAVHTQCWKPSLFAVRGFK